MPKKTKRARRAPRPTRRRPARKQPESLRLSHVTPSFTVNDLPRSVAWYRDVLGFTEGEHWEHEGRLAGVELKAGTAVFILNQDDFAMGRDRKKGEGFRLYCSTRQSVDRLAEAIQARGGVLAHAPTDRPWGSRDFAVVDPDGFKLTFATMT